MQTVYTPQQMEAIAAHVALYSRTYTPHQLDIFISKYPQLVPFFQLVKSAQQYNTPSI